jgi:hypothetical protein
MLRNLAKKKSRERSQGVCVKIGKGGVMRVAKVKITRP